MCAQTYPQTGSQHRLDGIVLVGKDFKFVKPLGLNIKGVFVQTIENYTLKGVTDATKGGRSFRVSFTSAGKLTLGYLITSRDRASNGLNKDSLHHLFVESVGNAVRQMKDSRTGRSYYRESTRIIDTIFPEDTEQFLTKLTFGFQTGCKNLARHNNWNCPIRTLAYSMGLDAEWNKLSDFLHPFVLEETEETIVHYAQDFFLDGYMLAWDSSASLLFPNGKVTSKYMVGFLKGIWNSYVSFSEQDSGHRHDEQYSIHEIKLYSELFKDMHRGNNLSFSAPSASIKLFSPREFVGGIPGPTPSWNSEKEKVLMAIQSIEDVKTVKHLAARIEAIVRIRDLDEDGPDAIETVKRVKRFLRNRQEWNNEDLIQKLRFFPLKTLYMHLKKNLLPFARSLEKMITNRIQSNGEKIWCGFGPDDFFTAMACENALKLGFYGTELRRGIFPYIVRDCVGLNVRTITNRRGPQFAEWIFGKYLKRVDVGDGLPIVIAKIPDPIGSNVLAELYQYFGDDVDETGPVWNQKLRRLVATARIYSAGILELEMKREIDGVANAIVEALIGSSLKFYKNHKFATRSLFAISRRNWSEERRVVFKSSFQMAGLIVNQDVQLHRHIFACWMSNVIAFVLNESDNKIDELRIAVAEKMEKIIMTVGQFFIIPIDQDSIFCVYPFTGTGEVNFNTITFKIQEKLAEEFVTKLQPFLYAEIGRGANSINKGLVVKALQLLANRSLHVSTDITVLTSEIKLVIMEDSF